MASTIRAQSNPCPAHIVPSGRLTACRAQMSTLTARPYANTVCAPPPPFQARRRQAMAAKELEAAEAEARAEALAQRVAASAERLAYREARAAEMREKLHAKWVESRLASGLTSVLTPADGLTR